MLKKTGAFLFSSPDLPARWIIRRLFPIVLLLSLMMTACQEPEKPEPYPDSDLVLEKLDVSCTEAWLKVSLSGADSSAATAIPVILTRDGDAVQSFSFTPPETLIVDAGLSPSQSYQYQAQRQSVHDNKVIDSSNTLTVTTLDTTSHDFTWTIDTLGNYGSYFNDVAIIDENNIWAVGDVQTDSGRYNLAIWDGNSWHMNNVGPVGNNLYSIFAFSEDDVWVANACSPFHWDGNEWSYYRFSSGGVGVDACAGNAIWGSSPEDVWFVGNSGSIVHYDGSRFVRLESGTDIDLLDIYGNATDKIWCVGYDDENGQAILLEYEHSSWRTKYEFGQTGSELIDGTVWNTVWSSSHNMYLPTVNGLWQESFTTKQGHFTNWHSILYNYYQVVKLRGNDDNDFMFVTNWGELFHFNGATWSYYPGLNTAYSTIPYSLDMKGITAVIVGEAGSGVGGIIILGNR